MQIVVPSSELLLSGSSLIERWPRPRHRPKIERIIRKFGTNRTVAVVMVQDFQRTVPAQQKKKSVLMEEEKEDDDQTAIITSTSIQLQSNQQMTTISRHKFGRRQTSEAFTIKIIENMKEQYGMFVWPCSIVLAEYVWQQRLRFSGVSVVELGAGTSLPGLVAAKVGSDVTLTDDSSRLEVLDNMRRTCDLNKLNCKVMGLSWGEWDAPIFSLQPKIVLGADVLYDAKDFDDLFSTVTFLLQTSPGSIFITSYHNRSGHHLIEYLMVKWCLKCTKLLDAFSFMPSNKSSTLTGNIQLAEIMLDDPQTGSS